nr:hypothetical protein [Terriglobales bacterium]
MATKVKTRWPGIYAVGDRYQVAYRDPAGKQHWNSCITIAEARSFKSKIEADKARGEYSMTSMT